MTWDWLFDPKSILIFAIVAPTVLLVFTRKLRGAGTEAWRPYEITALILAAFGLVGPISASRQVLFEVQANRQSFYLVGDAEMLKLMASGLSQCQAFTRTANSPENFDQLAREDAEICEWGRRFAGVAETLDASYPQNISDTWVREMPQVTEDLNGSLQETRDRIAEWNTKGALIRSLRYRASQGIDPIVLILAPYFLILAFGLTLAARTYKK